MSDFGTNLKNFITTTQNNALNSVNNAVTATTNAVNSALAQITAQNLGNCSTHPRQFVLSDRRNWS